MFGWIGHLYNYKCTYSYSLEYEYIIHRMIQRTIKQPSESDVAKTFKNDTQRENTSAQIISKGRFGEHDSGQGINKKKAMFQATAYLMRNSLVALVVASRILPCAELATLLVDVRCSWRPSAKLDEGPKNRVACHHPNTRLVSGPWYLGHSYLYVRYWEDSSSQSWSGICCTWSGTFGLKLRGCMRMWYVGKYPPWCVPES